MMASHIAHEFNNYLTPVLIYSELLENDDTISEENRQMIHEITDSVDKASDLSKKAAGIFKTGYRDPVRTAGFCTGSKKGHVSSTTIGSGSHYIKKQKFLIHLSMLL